MYFPLQALIFFCKIIFSKPAYYIGGVLFYFFPGSAGNIIFTNFIIALLPSVLTNLAIALASTFATINEVLGGMEPRFSATLPIHWFAASRLRDFYSKGFICEIDVLEDELSFKNVLSNRCLFLRYHKIQFNRIARYRNFHYRNFLSLRKLFNG